MPPRGKGVHADKRDTLGNIAIKLMPGWKWRQIRKKEVKMSQNIKRKTPGTPSGPAAWFTCLEDYRRTLRTNSSAGPVTKPRSCDSGDQLSAPDPPNTSTS